MIDVAKAVSGTSSPDEAVRNALIQLNPYELERFYDMCKAEYAATSEEKYTVIIENVKAAIDIQNQKEDKKAETVQDVLEKSEKEESIMEMLNDSFKIMRNDEEMSEKLSEVESENNENNEYSGLLGDLAKLVGMDLG